MNVPLDNPKVYPNLRTRVFGILAHRGIKESVFAQRLGMSESLLNKIKHGERSINQAFIDGAISILDLPYAFLFFDAVSPEGNTTVPSGNEEEVA